MKPEPDVSWFDDAHLPTEPGLYYWETCDDLGRPRPGLWYWEAGKPCQPSELPSKYFGPIRGAMERWPMTAASDEPHVITDRG